MAFFEQRLAECYSFGATGGPAWSTTVNKTTSGQRYANRNWTYPLHRFDIREGVRTKADFDKIRAFFLNVFGRADGFRFKDHADFEAVKQPTTVVTAGTVYQLVKRYIAGSRQFDRVIYKPVAGTVLVYRNGTLMTPTAIDFTTGQITIAGHTPGDVYTWTGQFDVPVAFVNDQLEAIIVDRGRNGLLIEWPSIQLEEIRL